MKYYKNYRIKTKNKDVFLASYPRSGNTWLRCLLANIIIKHDNLDVKYDIRTYQLMLPFDKHIVEKGLPQHTEFGIRSFPKIYKTHNAFSKKFKRSIYVVRDPRDTLVSYYHFQKFRKGKFKGNFSEYILKRADDWCENVKSWKGEAGVLIKYEDLKKNPKKEIKKILGFLGAKVGENAVQEAIKRCQFSKMQKDEVEQRRKRGKGLSDKKYFTVRQGESGRWADHFSEGDLESLRKKIKRHKLEDFLAKLGYKI